MGLINRDKDVSEQRETTTMFCGPVANGLTLPLAIVPYSCELQAIRSAAIGLSGAPTAAFVIGREIVGSGYTNISGGATTLTHVAVGTSGIQSWVLAASGNSLVQLQAGDVLTVVSGGGAGAAVGQLNVTFVCKALTDIKNQFNAF